MKKYFLISFIFFISGLVVLADDSRFIESLKNCSSYEESGIVRTDGMDVNVTKNILGKQNDRCVYKESVSFSGINAVTTCKLTSQQVNEIVSVTNAFSLLQQYSGESIDTSSLDAVKENPIVKVWSKYLQDSSTCNVTTN